MHKKSRPNTSQPIINAAPVTLGIICLCVVAHLLQINFSEDYKIAVLSAALYPKLLHAAYDGYALPYPLLTALSPLLHGFMHGDWGHLAVNMFFLLAIGTGLERAVGAWRFLIFYLILTLLSTIGPMLVYVAVGGNGIYLGASGAISGLFMIVLRFRPKGGFVALCVFIALNIGFGIIGNYSQGFFSQLAWEGHIAGAVAGFIIAPLMFGKGLFYRAPS